MTIDLKKTKYAGWVASTTMHLYERCYLKVQTGRGRNQTLETWMSEEVHHPDGSISFTIGSGHEINAVIIREQCNRVTSKAVEAQHRTVDFDAVMLHARKFHNIA
jgi:hypothetical protein